MKFRYGRACTAFLVVCSIANGALGSDAVSTPVDLSKQIVKVIPKDWRCEIDRENVIVRAAKPPQFINKMSAPPQLPNETDEEYDRRFLVTVNYRIVLRCCPKLSQTQVDGLIENNRVIMSKLDEIRKNPLVKGGKGDLWFDDSPEGAELLKKYDTLRMEVSPVPRGYVGELSVHLEPPFTGYATFLQEEDQKEHTMVMSNLNRALTPYANVSAVMFPVHIPRGTLRRLSPDLKLKPLPRCP